MIYTGFVLNCREYVNFLYGLDVGALCGLYSYNEKAISKHLGSSKKVLSELQKPGFPSRWLRSTKANVSAWLVAAKKLSEKNVIISFVIDCKLQIEAKERDFAKFMQAVSALRSNTISNAAKNCACGSFSNVSALTNKCSAGGYSLAKIREAFETLNMVSRCDDITDGQKLGFAVAVIDDKTTLAALKKQAPFISMLYYEDRRKNDREFFKKHSFKGKSWF